MEATTTFLCSTKAKLASLQSFYVERESWLVSYTRILRTARARSLMALRLVVWVPLRKYWHQA